MLREVRYKCTSRSMHLCEGQGKERKIIVRDLESDNTWTYTFDFKVKTDGWIEADNYSTTWIEGIGWRGTDPGNLDRCFIKRQFKSTYVFEISFTIAPSIDSDGGAWICLNDTAVGCTAVTYHPVGTTWSKTVNDMISSVSLGLERNQSGTGYLADIVSVSMSGIGTNPFLTHDGQDCPCNYVGINAEDITSYALARA
jgi:hypothetical protein